MWTATRLVALNAARKATCETFPTHKYYSAPGKLLGILRQHVDHASKDPVPLPVQGIIFSRSIAHEKFSEQDMAPCMTALSLLFTAGTEPDS